MRSILAVTLVLPVFTGACGGEAPARTATPVARTPAATEQGPTIVFLGDSLSAGLHLAKDEAFPAALQRLLAAEELPFRLINAGTSGDTTAGGLRRIDWLLKQEPDWVVIELGGNDGLRGVPVKEIEANLRAIVAKVRSAGARAALLGLCLPGNYGREYREGFEALYRRVAEDLELPFQPCFLTGVGDVPALMLPDGIHPTAAGHQKLAETLAPLFRSLLER
jgi:acyl-CoA thioesterase-1